MSPPQRKHPPISTYHPVLRPALTEHAHLDTFPAALAVTCRGLDAGIASSAICLWLRTHGGERFATITDSSRSFQPVLSRAHTKVASVSSLPARRREQVAAARRLVGSLLTPVPDHVTVRAHRQAVARHALAIVGLEILGSIRDHGWTTALVSSRWLAVQMGVEERAARAALRTCVELRWLRMVSSRRGGSSRYSLAQLRGDRCDTANRLAETVDALAEGDVTLDEVAEIVAAVACPSVGHFLGPKAWLVAVADRAEADPALLGIARRSVNRLRREWLAALVEHAGDPETEEPLAAILRRHADRSGAATRWLAAEHARREAAEARRIETERHRKHKKALYDRLLPLLLERHPIPPTDGDADAQAEWAIAARAMVDDFIPADIRSTLASAIATRMTTAGYQPDAATRVSRHIAGLPQKAQSLLREKAAA